MDAFGWWWLLIGPVVFVLCFLLVPVVALLLNYAEWCLISLKRCPHCKARKWSRGYTKGFGL